MMYQSTSPVRPLCSPSSSEMSLQVSSSVSSDDELEPTHEWVLSTYVNAMVSSCLICILLSASEALLNPLLPDMRLRAFHCDANAASFGYATFLAGEAIAGVFAATIVGIIADKHGRKPVLTFIVAARTLPALYLMWAFLIRPSFHTDHVGESGFYNPWTHFAVEWAVAVLGANCWFVIIVALLTDLIPTKYQSATILLITPFNLSGQLLEPLFVAHAASPPAAATASAGCCIAALLACFTLPRLWRERRKMRVVDVENVEDLDDDAFKEVLSSYAALLEGAHVSRSREAGAGVLQQPRTFDGPAMAARTLRTLQREFQSCVSLVRDDPLIGILLLLSFADVVADFDVQMLYLQYSTAVMGVSPATRADLAAVHGAAIVIFALLVFPLFRVVAKIKDDVLAGVTFVSGTLFAIVLLASPSESWLLYAVGPLAGVAVLSSPLLQVMTLSIVDLSHRATALGLRQSAYFAGQLIGPFLYTLLQHVFPSPPVPISSETLTPSDIPPTLTVTRAVKHGLMVCTKAEVASAKPIVLRRLSTLMFPAAVWCLYVLFMVWFHKRKPDSHGRKGTGSVDPVASDVRVVV